MVASRGRSPLDGRSHPGPLSEESESVDLTQDRKTLPRTRIVRRGLATGPAPAVGYQPQPGAARQDPAAVTRLDPPVQSLLARLPRPGRPVGAAPAPSRFPDPRDARAGGSKPGGPAAPGGAATLAFRVTLGVPDGPATAATHATDATPVPPVPPTTPATPATPVTPIAPVAPVAPARRMMSREGVVAASRAAAVVDRLKQLGRRGNWELGVGQFAREFREPRDIDDCVVGLRAVQAPELAWAGLVVGLLDNRQLDPGMTQTAVVDLFEGHILSDPEAAHAMGIGVMSGMLVQKTAVRSHAERQRGLETQWPLQDMLRRILARGVPDQGPVPRARWQAHYDDLLYHALGCAQVNAGACAQGAPEDETGPDKVLEFTLRQAWVARPDPRLPRDQDFPTERRRVVAAALRCDRGPLAETRFFAGVFKDWLATTDARPAAARHRRNAEKFLDAVLQGAPDGWIRNAQERFVEALLARFRKVPEADDALTLKLLNTLGKPLATAADAVLVKGINEAFEELDHRDLLRLLPRLDPPVRRLAFQCLGRPEVLTGELAGLVLACLDEVGRAGNGVVSVAAAPIAPAAPAAFVDPAAPTPPVSLETAAAVGARRLALVHGLVGSGEKAPARGLALLELLLEFGAPLRPETWHAGLARSRPEAGARDDSKAAGAREVTVKPRNPHAPAVPAAFLPEPATPPE